MFVAVIFKYCIYCASAPGADPSLYMYIESLPTLIEFVSIIMYIVNTREMTSREVR